MYSSGHSIYQDYRAIFLITNQGEYKYATKLSQITVVILSISGNHVVWSYKYMSVKSSLSQTLLPQWQCIDTRSATYFSVIAYIYYEGQSSL